jgi:hypothetical protein
MNRNTIFLSLLAVGMVIEAHAKAGTSSQPFQECDQVNFRELSHESAMLKAHPGAGSRQDMHLTLNLDGEKDGKKTLSLDDTREGDEPNSPHQLHRVIDIGPDNAWYAIFDTGTETLGYRLIHRQTGKIEEFNGCPIWSGNGHYFVALHEDLESGMTQNEASLWYCAKPEQSCTKIWSAPFGGKKARWSGNRAELILSKLDPSKKDMPELQKKVLCTPDLGKPNCHDNNSWSAVTN